MAFDEHLADRVRQVLQTFPEIQEKSMFGGLGFMLRGHLAVAISRDGLIVRFDRSKQAQIMSHPDAVEFAPTGRVMRGWALISPAGCEEHQALADWVHQSCAYTGSLPPKS